MRRLYRTVKLVGADLWAFLTEIQFLICIPVCMVAGVLAHNHPDTDVVVKSYLSMAGKIAITTTGFIVSIMVVWVVAHILAQYLVSKWDKAEGDQ